MAKINLIYARPVQRLIDWWHNRYRQTTAWAYNGWVQVWCMLPLHGEIGIRLGLSKYCYRYNITLFFWVLAVQVYLESKQSADARYDKNYPKNETE